MSITICPHCHWNLDPQSDSIYCEHCGGNIMRPPPYQFEVGEECNFEIKAFDPEAETAPVTLLPYVQATVREVMDTDDDPSIAPDYWLVVNCIASGHEFDIRASYVSPGL